MECATLSVNLAALASNYHILKNRHAKNSVAAVVKANAYGLGISEVSKALWREGCKDFFVATLAEGIELRASLPEANIAIFQGVFASEEDEYIKHSLLPILNDLGQLERFLKIITNNPTIPAIIHVDTGMTRLGLSEPDLSHPLLSKFSTQHNTLVISHLACADTPNNPKNPEQLSRLQTALKFFPQAQASLTNSAGVFLPKEFHFDIARTGCALYGINPANGKNPIQHVATLSAPILQIRNLDRNETIGYGATANALKGSKIAIIGLGYADGYLRSLSNQSSVYISEHKVPLIGRVSMDMVAVDISNIPEQKISGQSRAEFINATQTVDDIARQCKTIGYEIFTRIGNRVQRVYF